MIWTKASRFTPPIDVPVYVKYQLEDIHVCIFSEDDLKTLITTSNYDEWKKDQIEVGVEEDEIIEPRILEFWSFIPVFPPDEIIPALTKINDEIQRMQIHINELMEEITNIPRITSIQRMIEALQIQISSINPDPYQKWREKRLEKKNET